MFDFFMCRLSFRLYNPPLKIFNLRTTSSESVLNASIKLYIIVQLPNEIGSSTLSHKTGVQLLGSSEGCTPIFNLYSHIDRMCFYDIV